MNQFLHVLKGVARIDIIGSVVLLILMMGYVGLTNLQRDRVPSSSGVPTTTQQ
jgi:hypothetical protein